MRKQPLRPIASGRGTSAEARVERRLRVLRAVVESFIASAQPVGSKSIAAAEDCGVSPATVRNVMGELEAMGLLAQPHASSGRVPTASGFRAYVDLLLTERRAEQHVEIADDRSVAADHSLAETVREPLAFAAELPEFLVQTSRTLSSLCSCVGLVLRPRLSLTRLRATQFVRIGHARFVAVIVGDGGVIKDRVFRSEHDYSQEELDRISNYIVNRFAGCTLLEVQREVERELQNARAAYDAAMHKLLEVALGCIDVCIASEELYVDGAASCVEASEFEDVERVRQLLRAFEQKDRIARLLASCVEHDGVQIHIGGPDDDDSLPDLPGFALVAMHYGDGVETRGSVGVLGPMRMHYDRVIGIVENVARDVEVALRTEFPSAH